MTATTTAPTWDNQRIKQDRIALLQAQMQREGVGALYLGSGMGSRYALNLKLPGGAMFVPAEGELIAFVRPRDEGMVAAQHRNIRPPLNRALPGMSSDGPNLVAQGLADLMAERGLSGEKLGISDLRMEVVLELVRAGFDLVDASNIIEHTWRVKTDDEVAIYRLIGDMYGTTFNAFRDAIRPGVTEKALAHVITSTWEEMDAAEDIAQLNVCGGGNMNPWRRWPSDRAVQAGEFVGVDLHARGPLGLRGDSSTTFLAGDVPTDEQRDLYRRAHDYLQAVIPIWRAGRTIADAMADVPEVPERFRKKLWDLNYAHGCGLGSSGYPHLDPRQDPIDDVLQANEVLALEVYFGEVGSAQAVKLEQMVLIREGEPELLGLTPMDERFR